MDHGGDGSWARALMASAGVGVARDEARRQRSPEWREAREADLPLHRFHGLVRHREAEVREGIAGRLDCPLGVLASLAHDARASVRVTVAANPRANRAVLEHLEGDRDLSVVKAVARNSSTPADVLARLAQHRKAEVRRVAERTLAEREALVASGEVVAIEARGLPAELREGRPVPTTGNRDSVPSRRNLPAVYAPRPAVDRG